MKPQLGNDVRAGSTSLMTLGIPVPATCLNCGVAWFQLALHRLNVSDPLHWSTSPPTSLRKVAETLIKFFSWIVGQRV